jgi:hypothetical protein
MQNIPQHACNPLEFVLFFEKFQKVILHPLNIYISSDITEMIYDNMQVDYSNCTLFELITLSSLILHNTMYYPLELNKQCILKYIYDNNVYFPDFHVKSVKHKSEYNIIYTKYHEYAIKINNTYITLHNYTIIKINNDKFIINDILGVYTNEYTKEEDYTNCYTNHKMDKYILLLENLSSNELDIRECDVRDFIDMIDHDENISLNIPRLELRYDNHLRDMIS